MEVVFEEENSIVKAPAVVIIRNSFTTTHKTGQKYKEKSESSISDIPVIKDDFITDNFNPIVSIKEEFDFNLVQNP